MSIHATLRRQAEHAPEAVALLAPNRAPVSYGRLWAQIVHACRAIRATGVLMHDRVAIAIPDGLEMVLAFLSASAVATAAPISLALRESEYESDFAALGVTRLLTSAGDDSAVVHAARSRGIAVMQISIGDSDSSGIFAAFVSDAPAPVEDLAVRGDQIALALTTSGTTSRPKVVALTHADIYLAAVDTAASIDLTASDRLLNIMPLYHAHGLVGGMVTSLSAGASDVIQASTSSFVAPAG